MWPGDFSSCVSKTRLFKLRLILMVLSKLHVLWLVLRIACICRFGLFHEPEPEPKQSDPPDSWASKKKKKKRLATTRRFSEKFQLVVGTHFTRKSILILCLSLLLLFLCFNWSSLCFVLVSEWCFGLGLCFTVECKECRVLWNAAKQYYKVAPKSICVCVC